MSDLRIIPAEEAKALREKATQGPWAKSDSEFERSDIRTADQRFWIAMTGDEHEQSGEREEADRDLIVSSPDLAWTVEQQEAKIERVRKALHRIEQADEQAQHDWDTNYNPDSQYEALAYSMAAQWLEEALEGEENNG